MSIPYRGMFLEGYEMNAKYYYVLAAIIIISGVHSSFGKAADMHERLIGNREIAQDDATISARALYTKAKKPTTATELLANIKFAADHHLMLREDFYTHENLLRFFGGAQIRWTVFGEGAKSTSISADSIDSTGFSTGITISRGVLGKSYGEHAGKIHASVRVQEGNLTANIDKKAIFGLFGENWKLSHPYMRAQHEVEAQIRDNPGVLPHVWPLDSHGYETDRYESLATTDAIESTVSFTLSRDGRVLSFDFAEGER